MRPEDDPLRALFRRKVEAATRTALASDGRISARQVAQLARLARLVQIARATSTPAPARRLWLAGLVGVTLVLVTALLFARLGETQIQLDLELEEAGFVLSNRQVLTDVVRVSALGVSGLRHVTIPVPADRPAALAGAREASSMRIAATDDAQAGEISLAPVALPPGCRLAIEYADEPFAYRLSLDGKDIALQVGVRGGVGIAVIGAPPVAHNYASPRTIVLHGGDEPLDLELVMRDDPRSVFLSQLEITGLSLARVEQYPDPERSIVRRVSTIRSGTLHLEDLSGRTVSLRAGEPLDFEAIRGQIRRLELRKDHLALTFRGVARGMSTGWGTNGRSLMPTYLEWLRERHGLYLFWGSTVYLLGIVIGVLRWWGVRL